jgi:hypothetical protein
MLRPLVWAAVAGVLAIGCKSKGTTDKTDRAAQASAAAEPVLIAGPVAGPAGYEWRRLPPHAGIGSVEVPHGHGWVNATSEGLEVVNDKLDITIMINTQTDVGVDSRGEYMQSLTFNNKRDAPKYDVVARKDGLINRIAAGLLDGRFDNGIAYATRDYVLFAKGSAFVVMVRGPLAIEGDVRSIADRVAHSFQ